MECLPFKTNRDLFKFVENPFTWDIWVKSITPRCSPRYLETKYGSLNETEINLNSNQNAGKVLVCHDLMGNYRNDRFNADTPKWDDYRFYEWSGIDIFCYFSHEYITIPPIQWINAAHSNGVKIIGTYITEHENGAKLLLEALQSVEYMERMVEGLVLLAQKCNFDGWLFNVECPLPEDKIPMLQEFVSLLTTEIHDRIPGGTVIWYDSIICSGQLIWQNELNDKNKCFFDACDGIFTNYNWNDVNLRRTNDILEKYSEQNRRLDVFYGIDIFGRGQKAKFLTYETLSKIRENCYSVAIFAPGWTFESLQNDYAIRTDRGLELCNTRFLRNNEYFWATLWRYLNTYGPTDLPFYSSFCLGSGKFKKRFGAITKDETWFNLSSQSYQPSVPGCPNQFERYFDDAFDGGSCLKIINQKNNETSNIMNEIRLFVTNFEVSRYGIILSYAFKRKNHLMDVDLIAVATDSRSETKLKIYCGTDYNTENIGGCVNVPFLVDTLLKNVQIKLIQRGQKILPKTTPINGWEIRYHYLYFEELVDCRIIDIGLRVKKLDGYNDFQRTSADADDILLGAVSIHDGILQGDDLLNVNKIDSSDFV